jgi:hypothetical protein
MRLIDADRMANDKYPYNLNHCGALDIAEWVKNQPTVSPYEWISVEDRLPEKNTEVLVYHGDWIGNLMDVYTYLGNDEWEDTSGYWGSPRNEGITHWMPLPTPPTAKENEYDRRT